MSVARTRWLQWLIPPLWALTTKKIWVPRVAHAPCVEVGTLKWLDGLKWVKMGSSGRTFSVSRGPTAPPPPGWARNAPCGAKGTKSARICTFCTKCRPMYL